MANYCVVRTDLVAGTKNPDQLVSLRFYNAAGKVAEVENGVIVELNGYEDGQREVMKAVAATADSDMADCAVVAAPEVMYDERKKNLDEYINEAGKAVRGYRIVDRNLFSWTKEGFVGGTVPVVGGKVGIGTNGKLDAAGTGFGECVHIETAGRYTYYTIKIVRDNQKLTNGNLNGGGNVNG